MAKLTDDQLRFIIDLDASGAQGEINTLTADISKLEKENRSLKKVLSENEKEMSKLEKQLSKLEKSGKQNTKEYQNLQKTLTATRQNTAQLTAELNQNSQKINQSQQSVQKLTQGLKLSDMTMSQLRQRARQLQQQLDMTSKSANPQQYKKLQKELQVTTARMSELNTKHKGTSDILKTMWGNIWASAAIKGFQMLGKAISNIFDIYREFQEKSSSLAGTLGKTREEIQALTDQAQRLGATTTSTANQILDLQQSLAELGMSAYEIRVSTADIETFATALGVSTAEAAQLAGSALRDFKLPASEMKKVVETLGVATSKSALTFKYLQSSFETVAPTAHALGFTIEDTTVLLGSLANSGMKAGEAASVTKNLLIKLADANSNLAKKIGGPVKNMDEMTKALKQLYLSGTDFADILEISDRRSVTALETWIKQTDQLTELKTQITNTGDALEKMANIRTDNGLESVNRLKLAWADFSQSFMKSDVVVWLEEVSADMFEGLTNMLGGVVSSWQNKKTEARKSSDFISSTGNIAVGDMPDYWDLSKNELLEKTKTSGNLEELKKDYDSLRNQIVIDINELNKLIAETQDQALAGVASNAVHSLTQILEDAIKELDPAIKAAEKRIEEERIATENKEKAAAEERRKKNAEKAKKDAEELRKRLEQEAEERRKLNEQQYREDLDNAREFFEEQMLQLKQQYADRKMTDDEFRQHAFNLEMQHLESLKQIQEEYGDSTVQTDQQIADLRIKINEETDRLIAQAQKEANEALKEQLKETQDIFKELEGIIKDISSNIGSGLGGDLLSNFEKATKGVEKMMKALQSDTASQSEKIGASIAGIASVASAAMSQVSQITSAYFELETATLEAEKQKQLTIAGDNAEEREKVEQEYAQKELDLKKKQADADAGVQSAQLWINTAMGVASAWASCMQLGPIAGPIAAAILTGGLLATAGIEQAIILKNRDAIKNTTLESPQTASEASSAASSASSVSTNSTYTLKKEYSDGYADGGFTGEGDKFEPAGIVHRGEYVVPQAEMKNPVVVPMVRKIEAIRTARLAGRGTAADTYGYADGGYVEPAATGAGVQSSDDERLARTLSRLALILEQLQRQPLRATVNYRELESAGQKMNKIKSKL